MLDIENQKYKLGLVKWFGGYNHKKNKNNDFGFIQTMDGEDVFIHQNEINTGKAINENELVIFKTKKKNDKVHACDLYSVNLEEKVETDVLKLYLKYKYDYSDFFNSYSFKSSLIQLLENNINEENISFVDCLKREAKKDLHIFKIIRESSYWSWLFRILVGSKGIKELLNNDMPLDLVDPEYMHKNEEELYAYIEDLEEKDDLFIRNINILPANVILVSVIKMILTNEELISNRYSELNKIIESKFRETNSTLPEYVDKAFKTSFKSIDDYLINPTIWKITEPLLFKKHLYMKRTNVYGFFNRSLYLKNKIEFFILANLFPLIQAGNILDVVYKVFLHRLWESLSLGELSVNDKGALNVFPSCRIMGRYQLSCEAVYWPKTDKFLCRGRVCDDPKVKPDIEKHYLDFNIYDWFHHYGINYVTENNPSKKDFPIKLAGYFNRLKEIFNVLHCRKCNNLLKPDMRYSRVDYIDFESGEPVKKSMSAAYRATVFECGTKDCKEYKAKYYINHCVGFGCDSVIDTRDLKIKCDNGLYVCKGCGSCCEQHAKENSIGLCHECGSKLDLYEDERQTDHYGNGIRHVQCSNRNCSFKIRENLPKKFYLPSCGPVKIIR